jgi:acyl-CoA reductase-like NAD-dependent aldehyde dehydrogenase
MSASAKPQIDLPDPRLLIDGELVEAAGGASFAVINPATEEHLVDVSAAAAPDVDRAVRAARAQFDGGPWSRMSGPERRDILRRFADLIDRDRDRLAALEAVDVGKPVGDPRMVDIPCAAETFHHFAGWADRLTGETVPLPEFIGNPRFSYTLREPVGVIGAITPWNAPTMIAAWKIAPALAAGCTVVLKPPEDAPLSTMHLASLGAEAGLPPGVLNVVPGTGAEAGAALVSHSGVDKVSFTGSPEVGAEIARTVGPQFKRLTLELGGKSPQLIFPDADLDAAIPGAAISLFANAGETCAAGTRVLVHRDVFDEVSERLVEAAQGFKVGDPFAADTTMGSLINQTQLDRVLGYIKAGNDEGAELLTGGERVGSRGYFVAPTLFSGNNSLRIAQEEIFGPVGTLVPFAEDDEAVALANATKYGLIAVVWTQNLSRAHRLAAKLRVGAVWVNGWGPPDPRLPWGGRKTSGVGRDLGQAGIESVTEQKAVSVIL